MTKIRFTKKQIKYITHRPEDCLAEVAVNSDFPDVSLEAAHSEAWDLMVILDKNKLDLDKLSPIQKFMLKDCFEGSTFHCNSYAHGAPGEFDKDIETGRTAAKKLEKYLGAIDVPIW